MAHIYPMGLIFTSLLLLSVPGIIYNNFLTSGLSPTFSLSCGGPYQPGQNPDFTCQNPNPAGCQLAPSSCTLNGTSISFLNGKSPFTALIQGNVWGFFTGITNNGNGLQGGRGPFDALGGTYITVNCEVAHNIDGHQTNAAIGGCTETNPDNSNTTFNNAITWGNWNFQQNGSTAPTFIAFSNPSHTAPVTAQTCSWLTQINYTLIAGGPGWTYFGCDLSAGSHIITHQIWSFLVAMPVDLGGIPAGTTHMYLYVQVENQDFDTLPSQNNPFLSTKFENWFQTFKGITISGGSLSTTQYVPGFNGPVLGFLFGVALLIGGLGLNFAINGTFFGTGGGISAGINRQGTKLMQTLGLGLIVWSFLYSQFATWFISGILPNGLDGSLGIVSVLLSGLFFGGIFWETTNG